MFRLKDIGLGFILMSSIAFADHFNGFLDKFDYRIGLSKEAVHSLMREVKDECNYIIKNIPKGFSSFADGEWAKKTIELLDADTLFKRPWEIEEIKNNLNNILCATRRIAFSIFMKKFRITTTHKTDDAILLGYFMLGIGAAFCVMAFEQAYKVAIKQLCKKLKEEATRYKQEILTVTGLITGIALGTSSYAYKSEILNSLGALRRESARYVINKLWLSAYE